MVHMHILLNAALTTRTERVTPGTLQKQTTHIRKEGISGRKSTTV